MQILDVDYVVVNERPILRLFGHTADGKSVCAFYEGFYPYFYATPGAEKLIEGKTLSVEQVARKTVKEGMKTFSKITITNPAKTPEYRDLLTKAGHEVLEADILFRYRFMADSELRGLDWITVEGADVSTVTVSTARAVQARSFKVLNRVDNPFRILALDIECVAIKPGMPPEASKDPIIMISLCYTPEEKGQKTRVLTTRAIPGMDVYEDEKTMLEAFNEAVKAFDPDIMTGFNCNNFDFPYIFERMKQNRVKPIFGRCQTKQAYAQEGGVRFKVNVPGRVVVDSYEIVKKDFSLQRYNLDFVSRKLLKKEKDNVRHSEIEKLWNGTDAEVKRLAEYARKDAILAMDLVVELNLLDKYGALSRVAGTLLQDTLQGGETVRIENYLLREFNREGYVFPARPPAEEVGEREKIKRQELIGGYVIEPEKKLHSNVVVLDFMSMYPSIIRTFNICPTTLVTEGGVASPSGGMFLPKEVRQGIVPRILETLMNERQTVKKAMKKAQGEEARVLYAKQWALKILANAFYGHMGYARARIYDLRVANAITSYGREIIGKTVQQIEAMGYHIVYGDTDSVFVVIPEMDLDKTAEKAREIALTVTKGLPGVMMLDFDKVFKRFLPLSKKRYIAWSFSPGEKGWEEGMVMKGIETVRRDWCELVGGTVLDVINILLKQEDVKEAVRYFKSVIRDLVEGKIPLQRLVVTKTMTKSVQGYAGIQPHIELVKKIQARTPGEAPGIGDRIAYVIVKGTDLLSKRAEDPTYVTEHHLQIDAQYYIENQLLPPVERIFTALDISKSELLGTGKQMGIWDAFKPNGKPAEIRMAEVNGFVCEKCGSFFSLIPLRGGCACGGQVVFTSPKGRSGVALLN